MGQVYRNSSDGASVVSEACLFASHGLRLGALGQSPRGIARR